MPGPEQIVVLVPELDNIAPELGKVPVYVIEHAVTLEFCLLLLDTDRPDGFYHTGFHIPDGSVAKEIGIIVEEHGIAGSPAVCPSVPLRLPESVSLHKTHETVFLLIFLRLRRENGQEQQRKKQKRLNFFHTAGPGLSEDRRLFYSDSLNFTDHAALLKTQSRKRGSITIYVVLIFSFMKLSIASMDFFCFTIDKRRS